MTTAFEYVKQEGWQEGRQEGELIGVEKTSLKIAKRLLAQNFSVDKIAHFTGLAPETIRTLNINEDDEE